MNTYIKEIHKMMNEADLYSISLIYERKQTIQREGISYHILEIYAPDERDDELELTTIPSYGWRCVHLSVGDSWPERTWKKLTRIVREYIERRES